MILNIQNIFIFAVYDHMKEEFKTQKALIQTAFFFPITITNLMKTPIKYLPYFRTFKSHSLKVSFVVIVKESQCFTTICEKIKIRALRQRKKRPDKLFEKVKFIFNKENQSCQLSFLRQVKNYYQKIKHMLQNCLRKGIPFCLTF